MLKRLLDRIYSAVQNTIDEVCAPVFSGPGGRKTALISLVPNALSLVRIPLGIAIWQWAGANSAASTLGLIALAMATDVLDGYLARRLYASTVFGAILDPWCDKVFFLCCIWGYRTAFTPWLFWPLLSIEAVIMASPILGALWLSSGRKVVYSSNIYGKSKFAVECFALLSAILWPAAASWLLGVALALALLSIIEQIKKQPPGCR